MEKLYIVSTVAGLLTGVFIGYHADHNPIEPANKTENCSQIQFYDDMIFSFDEVKIYDSSELTEEILTNRNGKIIIEKVIGKVTIYKLDGTIVNASTDYGTYISYKRVDRAKENDIIVTYFIYSPFSNAEDDVLTRLDFIIDTNTI